MIMTTNLPRVRLLAAFLLLCAFHLAPNSALTCLPIPPDQAEAHRKLLDEYTKWVPGVPTPTSIQLAVPKEDDGKPADAPTRISFNGTAVASDPLSLPEQFRPKKTVISYPIPVTCTIVSGGMTAERPVEVSLERSTRYMALKIKPDGVMEYFVADKTPIVCPQNCLCQVTFAFSPEHLVVFYP